MNRDAAQRLTDGPSDSWQEGNQRYLQAALNRLQRQLQAVAEADPLADPAAVGAAPREEDGVVLPAPAALTELCQRFALSEFERELVLLCAGVELDATLAALCARLHGARRPYVTFGLALALFPTADWTAIAPTGALRRAGLLELLDKESLTDSRLRIDERVLHYLTGLNYLDEQLQPLLFPVPCATDRPLPDSQTDVAARIALVLSRGASSSAATPVAAGGPLIQIHGADSIDRQAICAATCAALGLPLHCLRAAEVPCSASERERLRRLWQREVTLGMGALQIAVADGDSPETLRSALLLAERLPGVVLLSGCDPLPLGGPRSLLRFAVSRPKASEQHALWHQELGPLAPPLNGQVEQLVSHFNLSPDGIRTASTAALAGFAAADNSAELGLHLWESCRVTARARLDDLAQRIEPAADFGDLVLPEAQLQTLYEIAAQRRHQPTVYHRWGFAAKGLRGLGITVLFAGSSGTGKTLAAEVLAHTLRLDLYRIDLSQVVSKYIGETEKNLRRVFDAAEEGGAILLFDEADALFGKRSEVKDSHDRHANIEVSYLLQRMESYQGLSILTSNLKSSLDTAFLRRLRFIVQFPFPDLEQRCEIWRRAFPGATPVDGLLPAKLARLNVAGGHIRNIALNAAFLAAAAKEPVRMQHLLRAARSECSKMEKPLTEAEIGGWI